jgi:hypothetical protein
MADDSEIAAILAEANKSEGGKPETKGEASAASPAASGGGNPWIPVAVVAIVCPLLSFLLIQFLILPKMENSLEAVAVRMEAIQSSQQEEGHAVAPKKEKPAAKEHKKESKGEGHGAVATNLKALWLIFLEPCKVVILE